MRPIPHLRFLAMVKVAGTGTQIGAGIGKAIWLALVTTMPLFGLRRGKTQILSPDGSEKDDGMASGRVPLLTQATRV